MNPLGIAVGLAMDAAAVSAARGMAAGRPSSLDALRVALVFGGFQALMPVLGYYFGAAIGDAVHAYAGWIAGTVFLILAGRLVWEAFHEEESASGMSWAELLPLGVATSIDAFAIGVVVKLMDAPLWPVVIYAGVVTAALSAAALLLGGALGRLAGSRTGIRVVGALVLAGLGVDALMGA